MENLLEKLNESQREAVVYTDGPQLVIAAIGSETMEHLGAYFYQ